MAFTFNGIGTAFFGKRDFAADGSYVTTEWVCFLIPIIPIRSLRVHYQAREHSGFPGVVSHSSDSYAVYHKTRPNVKQVLSVYGFMGVFVSWAYLAGRVAIKLNPRAFDTNSGLWIMVLMWLIPALLPWFLRRRARQKLMLVAGKTARTEIVHDEKAGLHGVSLK